MKPTIIHSQSKRRALAMADYMAEYGIEVVEVKIEKDGNSRIWCVSDDQTIRDTINQFNNDYGTEL